MREATYGKTSDDALLQALTAKIKAGETVMSVLGPWDLQSYKTLMEENDRTPNLGIASISSMQITNTVADGKLSGFAGGYGYVVKSTISNKVNQTNDGDEITKTQAAMMVIDELAKKDYATDLAKGDGKYSTYQDNIDKAYKDFSDTEGMELFAQAIEQISFSYNDGGVTARPNTSLFDIYWAAWADNYRLSMNPAWTLDHAKTEFRKLFNNKWDTDKAAYVWG
ncbi:putative lipoprotein [Spiroplasma clarkii]|nr:hypothetical protein [Spiroplasma clarkii]ARU90939.1 putative lipoprotein [Spiroplasma clarkii]